MAGLQNPTWPATQLPLRLISHYWFIYFAPSTWPPYAPQISHTHSCFNALCQICPLPRTFIPLVSAQMSPHQRGFLYHCTKNSIALLLLYLSSYLHLTATWHITNFFVSPNWTVTPRRVKTLFLLFTAVSFVPRKFMAYNRSSINMYWINQLTNIRLESRHLDLVLILTIKSCVA